MKKCGVQFTVPPMASTAYIRNGSKLEVTVVLAFVRRRWPIKIKKTPKLVLVNEVGKQPTS